MLFGGCLRILLLILVVGLALGLVYVTIWVRMMMVVVVRNVVAELVCIRFVQLLWCGDLCRRDTRIYGFRDLFCMVYGKVAL